jgi:hypothetical protein
MNIQKSLFPVVFLAVALSSKADSTTNSVCVATNFRFFLCSSRHPAPQSQFRSDEMIIYTLAAAGTNTVYHRRLPTEQAFDFKLLDERGQEVPKTKLGLKDSQPVNAPKTRWGVFKLKPQAVDYEPRQLFRPAEMFLITNKGVYELQVRVRLCVPMTNGVPDSGGMLSNHDFVVSKQFGVVVSELVRVKILKE